ncbi:hypothetical protein EVAR_96933_1 [Eumeta japonica]|uniref:Uncharacterized protein n=1 Tax=Eumeta variegata TaxID=151549 RepID=A0A4C1ZVW4_EUMVA|nr:hypothetical protein EVAR_96933_1 [Eumeta japonica]
MDSSNDSLSVLPNPPTGSPAVLLTPGRTRNIAQDMEALRLSRQDNPYLQQVMASRESLIENHLEDCESDDTVLMSQEFGSTPLDFVEEDPLTLKEIHEHLIRSPPPISCWPHDTLSLRASSAFDFSVDSPVSYSNYSVNSHQDKVTNMLPYSLSSVMFSVPELLSPEGRSPRRVREEARGAARARSSRSASPRAHDITICGRPLSLPGESHLRNALSKKGSSGERFTLLQNPRARRRADDSRHLVQDYK